MSNKKPWSGRFSKKTHPLMEKFSASIDYDQILAKYDLAQSKAHTQALLNCGVLNKTEANKLLDALTKLENDFTKGNIKLIESFEDIHLNIEHILTQKLGDLAKKLHAGRSRNDMIATDLRMFLKDEISYIKKLINELQKSLISLAEKNISTIFPGYTHLQQAQPILFTHHLLAYFEMFSRDFNRFQECFNKCDVLPLGSGALAGINYSIDRRFLAKNLGFSNISENSIDAVSDRDFILDFYHCLSLIFLHLSRFSEEIILWSSKEFNFIEISDDFATGSSIMPQKKNPDLFELIRAKAAKALSRYQEAAALIKGLPLSYNRDFQELNKDLFEIVIETKSSLKIFAAALAKIKINRNHILKTLNDSFLTATDLADYFVKKGVPFREAHEITGRIVKYCLNKKKHMQDLSLKEIKAFSTQIDNNFLKMISLEASISAKNIYGGTSPKQVKNALKRAKSKLKLSSRT